MATPSRRALRRATPLAFVLVATTLGCLAKSNDVILLRPQLPALAEGCPVSVLADAQAPFPVEDLVEITYTYTPGGRDLALRALRERACYFGGDTLYKLREEDRGTTTTRLTALIARRSTSASTPASASTSGPTASASP